MSPVGVIATGLCRFVGQQIEPARIEDLRAHLVRDHFWPNCGWG